MQSSNGVRGYSDFFTSGLRAVTNRARRASFIGNSIDVVPNLQSTRPTSRRTKSDITQLRARPASDSPPTMAREKRRGRRSSIISLSSALFNRMSSSSFDGGPAASRSGSRRSSGSPRIDDHSYDENMPEVWITAGGPYTPSAPNGSPALHQPIDPFSPSPDSRSFFIDLSSDGSPSGTPKHESFLSLTGSGSSSTLSSLILPSRRERPTSIHTMPLPSRSRRSSFQYRPPSQEKSDFFGILEEEPTGNLTNESIAEDDEWDAPAKIDWHQFHIDILTDD